MLPEMSSEYLLVRKEVVQAEMYFSCNENSFMCIPFSVSVYNIIPKLWVEYFG